MTDRTGHQVGVGVVVVGQGHWARYVMTRRTGWCLRVAGVAVACCGGDVAVMGELSVLGGMALVALIVWLNDRSATRCTRNMTLLTGLV